MDAIAYDAAISEASQRVRELESIVADLRRLLGLREMQIASMRTEQASLRGPTLADDTSPRPMLVAPIDSAIAAPIRVSARDADRAPSAAGAPPPNSGVDPLMVGFALALLVLVGVGIGVSALRSRRPSHRAAVPDTFMS